METCETVEIVADCMKDEIKRIEYQLERLEGVALCVNDPELEANLRGISTEIRRSAETMRTELEADEPWLAG